MRLVAGGLSAGCHLAKVTMLLSLFYLAVGILSVVVCWLFVTACDRL